MLLGVLLFLSGCGGDTLLSQGEREFIVVSYEKPVDFTVTLEDLLTHEIYENIPVSTYCDDYPKLKIDSIWSFNVKNYVDNSGKAYSVIDATGLCSKLEKML